MKDRTTVNHKIRKHFNELIYNVARYTEVVLSHRDPCRDRPGRTPADPYNCRYLRHGYGYQFFYQFPVTGSLPCSWCGVCKNALPPFRPDRC